MVKEIRMQDIDKQAIKEQVDDQLGTQSAEGTGVQPVEAKEARSGAAHREILDKHGKPVRLTEMTTAGG